MHCFRLSKLGDSLITLGEKLNKNLPSSINLSLEYEQEQTEEEYPEEDISNVEEYIISYKDIIDQVPLKELVSNTVYKQSVYKMLNDIKFTVNLVRRNKGLWGYIKNNFDVEDVKMKNLIEFVEKFDDIKCRNCNDDILIDNAILTMKYDKESRNFIFNHSFCKSCYNFMK